MLVELDIFSGRPNPRWELDEPVARTVTEFHRQLRPVADVPPGPPGLGYRGFVYSLDHVSWRAWRGFVVGPALVLADPDRTIERMLLDLLPAEYLDLRPRLEVELKRGG